MMRCAISAKSRVGNCASVSQGNKTSLMFTISRWRTVALLLSADNKISQVLFLCCQVSEMLSASSGILELVRDCVCACLRACVRACVCRFTYYD